MTRVFVSGSLDNLHPGHIELFEFAKSLGDHLTVSIASDATLRAYKREPLFGEHDRWRMVSAIRFVDAAFVARGEHSHRDCFSYVRTLRPDVWVIDANDPHRAEKEKVALESGSRIVLNHRPEAGTTTTGLIERIRGLE